MSSAQQQQQLSSPATPSLSHKPKPSPPLLAISASKQDGGSPGSKAPPPFSLAILAVKSSERAAAAASDTAKDCDGFSSAAAGGHERPTPLPTLHSPSEHDSKGEQRQLSSSRSSPSSYFIRSRHRRSPTADSDDDGSPVAGFKRQRLSPSPSSPLQTSTPPCSPMGMQPQLSISAAASLALRPAFPVQPSPSPLLRLLTLDSSDASPVALSPSSPSAALDEEPAVSAFLLSSVGDGESCSVSVSSSSLSFSRPLSLIIEEAEEIIVPVPYTPTPHSSPASPRGGSDGCLVQAAYLGVSMRKGVRKQQQDAFVCSNASGRDSQLPSFLAVMDGHGVEGAEVSKETAEMLPAFFFSQLRSAAADTEAAAESGASSSAACSAAFASAFSLTDHHVCEERGYRGGSTACCVYIAHDASCSPPALTLHIASVGDSRAILLSASRPPELLTTDHSTSSPSEQQRITAAGGHLLFTHCSLRVNGVLNVTRSIGDRALKEFIISQPDTRQRSLSDGDDSLLIISDGVSSALSMDELQSLTLSLRHLPPAEQSERIVEAAIRRGSKDNVTAIVLHLPTYAQHIAGQSAHEAPRSLSISGDISTLVSTPPPSRERREPLPPVPPFVCSPALSCSLTAGEGEEEESVICAFIPPPLTSRSGLSMRFFSMSSESKAGVFRDRQHEPEGEDKKEEIED